MKIVVIGGTGLIGSKTVAILRRGGHEVVAASPKSGVNSITGEGLKEAMSRTQVVIDLTNSPSFEDRAVLDFFEASGRNLLPGEAAAGVRHHVALSIVAIDRTDNGYFRAKVAQEKLIRESGIPYTIVRATQFMEFLGGIADSSTDGNTVKLPPILFQPIAADDVAAVVAEAAVAAPRNGRHRDRRAATGAVQRDYHPLFEGSRRPTRGRERPRSPLLGWHCRRTVSRTIRRRPPRPYRSRRMAPRRAGKNLILHPPTEGKGPMKRILCAVLVASLPFGSALADALKSKNAKVTLVYQHELPNVPGKSIKGVLVEYGAGGSSPCHTHPKSAFIYATVLEGAIRSQVNDGAVTTYKTGQSFSELPGERHGVSANASETRPAKLLAVFVVDTNETELTIPCKG